VGHPDTLQISSLSALAARDFALSGWPAPARFAGGGLCQIGV